MTTDTDIGFCKEYCSIVKAADALLSRPSRIRADAEQLCRDVTAFAAHLRRRLPELEAYPMLMDSLFSLMEHDSMTGSLGVFIIDDSLARCAGFKAITDEICDKAERIRQSSATVNPDLLNDLKMTAASWTRHVTIDNMDYVHRFLVSRLGVIDNMYESLNEEEKLGNALARSEEERRRLLEREDARRRGLTEKELEREERRRQAREEFSKGIKTRKKK